MSTPPAFARVFGFVATEADVCVLLRRGPSKQVLMVRWNLATDEFEIGQWLNARVYEDRSGLSPDGQIFVYQANSGHYFNESTGVYSAVCRPPYFTALAFWAQQTTHDLGLQWANSPRSFLDAKAPEPTKGTLRGRYSLLLRERTKHNLKDKPGWTVVRQGATPILARDSLAGGLKLYRSESGYEDRFWLGNRSLEAQWVDVDRCGRLLFAREGRIYVHDADGERELIDLNPLKFRPLEPPEWATEWPTP